MLKGPKARWNLYERSFIKFLWSLWGKVTSKISSLWKFESLGVFVNTLTANEKYPVPDCENLQFNIEMQLSCKRKTFSDFLFNWWNLHQILNIFGKKTIGIANIFPRLGTAKNLVKPLSKNHCFRTSFNRQQVKGSQTLVKSTGEIFYHIFWSLWGKMTCKIWPLLNFEILRVFVNTLTAEDKYPVGDCQNLQFNIEMQLSYKRKTFSNFFVRL